MIFQPGANKYCICLLARRQKKRTRILKVEKPRMCSGQSSWRDQLDCSVFTGLQSDVKPEEELVCGVSCLPQ